MKNLFKTLIIHIIDWLLLTWLSLFLIYCCMDGLWFNYQIRQRISWPFTVWLMVVLLIAATFYALLLMKRRNTSRLYFFRIFSFLIVPLSLALGSVLPAAEPLTDDCGYYILQTPASFEWFTEQINRGNDSLNARLGRNLILNDTDDWELWDKKPPAHVYEGITGIYKGIFDGAGYTIQGYYTDSRSGLFISLDEKAVVKNLELAESLIETDYSYERADGKIKYFSTGSICNYNYGLIQNCTSNAVVTGTGNAGGIAGYNGGEIHNTEFSGTVKTPKAAGGIVGYNTGVIHASSNSGNILSAGDCSRSRAGGIAGFNGRNADIKNCLNTGPVTAYANAGGIAGYNYSDVSYCINYGEVLLTSQYQSAQYLAGGIAGGNHGLVNRCANAGKVRTSEELPGLVSDMSDISVTPVSHYISNIEGSGVQNCYYLYGVVEENFHYRSEDTIPLTEEQMEDISSYLNGERNIEYADGMNVYAELPDNMTEMGVVEADFIPVLKETEEGEWIGQFILKQGSESFQTLSSTPDSAGYQMNSIHGWRYEYLDDTKRSWRQWDEFGNSGIELTIYIMDCTDSNAELIGDMDVQRYKVAEASTIYISNSRDKGADNQETVHISAYRSGEAFTIRITATAPAEAAERLEEIVLYSVASFIELPYN